MAATYSKQILSGSSNGRMIKVAATATLGTTIHSAGASALVLDETWLWAVNSDTTRRKLTIEWGSNTSPDDLIEVQIEAEKGLYLVIPGLILTQSAVCHAFCETANVVMIGGFVNRSTST